MTTTKTTTVKRATKKRSIYSYVIVRCQDAGVHAGILVEHSGREVHLRDSRRLWRWWSRFSLSELATEGVRADKAGECRFSCTIPHEIALLDACEILPCAEAAEQSIRRVPDANR